MPNTYLDKAVEAVPEFKDCISLFTKELRLAQYASLAFDEEIGSVYGRLIFVDRFTVPLCIIFAMSCIIIDQFGGLDIYLIVYYSEVICQFFQKRLASSIQETM